MSAAPPDLAALLPEVRRIAFAAGAEIRRVGLKDAREKDDGSPVTAADEAADRLIVAALGQLTPGIPVVSEESVESMGAPVIDAALPFWLVDPLDGTKEFLKGRDTYTVNIGLVVAGTPVLGVIAAPARGTADCGAFGLGASRHTERGEATLQRVRQPPARLVAVASASHEDEDRLDRFLADYPVASTRRMGGALKFALVAGGEVDLYPRFGGSMEWDTAAGHALIEAAGGSMTTPDGQPLRYAKPGFRNGPFVARGWR